MKLRLLDDSYGICALGVDDPLPGWSTGPGVSSVTRTEAELSILCPEGRIPEGIDHEPGWRGFEVAGPLAFELVGVLLELLEPLAGAGVPVFAISTYLTDYVFVQADRLPIALAALESTGHEIRIDS